MCLEFRGLVHVTNDARTGSVLFYGSRVNGGYSSFTKR
jgi:hypothetical protein